MAKIHREAHWEFALVSAIYRLIDIVWEFDFDKEVEKRAYTDIYEPAQLVKIIDGFLAEPDLLYQGDVDRLKRMREQLSTRISAAFDSGANLAHQLWTDASQETIAAYQAHSFDDLHDKAKTLVDTTLSLSEQSWFIEAFCKTWQSEWGNSLQPKPDDSQ